jgi:sortase A
MGAVWHALGKGTSVRARVSDDARRMHRTLRILSIVLITAGLVVLSDVAATLAWKEPVSSIYGAIQQQRARDDLDELEDAFAERPLPDVRGLTDVRAAGRLANAFEDEVATGRAIGKMLIPGIDLDVVVVQGTDTSSLQKGPGHYPHTALPGQGKTIGVAGHRTTYLAPFRHIDQLEPGDGVVVEMPYGDFTYGVTKTEIVDPEDVEIVDNVGFERLVLTACHPLYSAAERYAIFARLVEIDLDSA